MATAKSGWKSENGKMKVRDGNEDEEKESESDEDDDDGQKFEDFRKKKSSEDNVYSHNVSSHGSVLTEERLIIRRALEANIVRDNDRGDLKKGEFYYLIDSQWLQRWSEFTQNAGPFPGKISSSNLIDSKGKPLPNLKAKVSYRGVIPIVYFIFVALHGWDRSPHVCRYKVDITAPAVPIDKVFDIQYAATTDSRIMVHDIRQKWQPPLEEVEDEEEKRICTCCCFGYYIDCLSLRKEHLEAFIYWMIMCWSRNKSGRGNIKYSQYTPLSTSSEHGSSSHGASSHGSSSHGRSSKGKLPLSSQEIDDPDESINGQGNLNGNVRVGLADRSYESRPEAISGWTKVGNFFGIRGGP